MFPKPEWPGSETHPNPQLWSTLSSEAQQAGGALLMAEPSVWVSCWTGQQECHHPAALSPYRPSAVAVFLSAPSMRNSPRAWASFPAVVKQKKPTRKKACFTVSLSYYILTNSSFGLFGGFILHSKL